MRTRAGIHEALDRVHRGDIVCIVDSPDRENEGDLMIAADRITPEVVNFFATHARGLICMPCDSGRLADLRIGPMLTANTCHQETAFTVTIDHRSVSTGISVSDRSATIRAIVDPSARPSDFVRPGHVFPLRARSGGVLVRPGHTEAAVDLARLAGLNPCAAICEVLNPDGTVARFPDLEGFVRHHDLALICIEDLIEYRSTSSAAL